MQCPVCQAAMVQEDFGGIHVDVCRNGCKGIWFDWTELRKLDEKNEGLGNALKEGLDSPRSNDGGRGQITCPKCGLAMHTHLYESSKEVNVDECYGCGGFFLDSGELNVIRETFMSEAERAAYAAKLRDGVPAFGQAQKELAKVEQRNEAVARFTNFIGLGAFRAGK